MPFVNNDGTKIFYREVGQGEPMLLLSPIGSDTPVWDNMVSVLSLYFKVIRMDYRGTGESDKPDEVYTNESFIKDISLVMDALGCPYVHLVGHAMGGFIAEHFAAEHPDRVRDLTLIASLPYLTEKAKKYILQQLEYADTDPQKMDVFVRQAMMGVPHQPVFSIKRQLEYCLAHDARERLSDLTMPVLILSGDEEKVMTSKISHKFASMLPHAEVKILEHCGHIVQMEAPDAAAEAIVEFCLK